MSAAVAVLAQCDGDSWQLLSGMRIGTESRTVPQGVLTCASQSCLHALLHIVLSHVCIGHSFAFL